MATDGGRIDFMFLGPPPTRPLDPLLDSKDCCRKALCVALGFDSEDHHREARDAALGSNSDDHCRKA